MRLSENESDSAEGIYLVEPSTFNFQTFFPSSNFQFDTDIPQRNFC